MPLATMRFSARSWWLMASRRTRLPVWRMRPSWNARPTWRTPRRRFALFLPVLDCPLNGTSGLFRARLATRLRWVQENRRSEQQRKLAHQYLSRGDFVRAAMFGREACDKHVREEFDLPIDERPSDETQEAMQRFVDELASERRHAYYTLRQYRNAFAHGKRPESRMQAALKNPQELRRELERALKTFFGLHQRSAGSLRLALEEAVLDAPQ